MQARHRADLVRQPAADADPAVAEIVEQADQALERSVFHRARDVFLPLLPEGEPGFREHASEPANARRDAARRAGGRMKDEG